MSVIRGNQPGITRVLPHPQNKKWAIPQRTLPLFIIALGDSLTDNQVPTHEEWLDFTQYPNLTVSDEGIPGSPLWFNLPSSYLNRIDTVLLAAPDADCVVIQSCGTNDILQATTTLATVQDLLGAMDTLLAKTQAAGMAMVSGGCIPAALNVDWSAASDALAAEWNPAIAGWCADNGVPYVDNWSLLSGDTPGEMAPEYDSGDGLHPNAAGAAVVAAATDAAMKAVKYRHQNKEGSGKWGYLFDSNQLFQTDTYQTTPNDPGVLEIDLTLTEDSDGLNMDLVRIPTSESMARCRGTGNSYRALINNVGQNTTTATPWVKDQRFTAYFKFPADGTAEVGSKGQTLQTLSVGTGGTANFLQFSNTGTTGIRGIVWGITFFEIDGTTVKQHWSFNEGQGEKVTSDQGAVATLSGTPGIWVEDTT